MKYISVGQFADKFGISERTVRNYCAKGKIEGTFLTGKTWNIPVDATLPNRKAAGGKIFPLLAVLREQKASRLKGGIYHRTQIDLTYNSNHIEGSRLTHDQTRYIYETCGTALLMFKECLHYGHVPFIITDELKMYYYRGLREWGHVNGYLTDTCLAAQDNYKGLLDYFKIKY